MGSASILSLYVQPKHRPLLVGRTCFRFRTLVVRAADGGARRPSSGRIVYRQSQGENVFPIAPVQKIASFVVPVGAFIAVTFADSFVEIGGENMMRKPKRPTLLENKSPAPVKGMNWSFAAGTNLFPGLTGKIGRESKQKPNEFAKEIRSFSIVDMSGCNFGDEGLFFLAESLAYNQTLEEVSFAANGITAEGMRAFDRVLQSNIVLKTLNLSGNPIGDEGATGFTSLAGAFLENATVQSIYPNGNYGGALAKGLKGNKSLRAWLLKELHLQGNSIREEGARALMSGLSSSKAKLTHLDLGNNSISAKGAFHVAEYLKKSKSLFWMNVYMNDMGDWVLKLLNDYLHSLFSFLATFNSS